MDLEEIKAKLRSYPREKITFNEPHFSNQIILRQGSRTKVLENICNPENLMHFHKEGEIYCLYFKMSNTRTMKLPVIFGKKLFILTYIMRYRKWQSMVK